MNPEQMLNLNRRNLPILSTMNQKIKPERIFPNIESDRGETGVPEVQKRRHWRIMVDQKTAMKLSELYETKNGMFNPKLRINIMVKEWS